VLDELLPAAVVCEERFDDPPDAVLLEGEGDAVARAVERRRREYTTTRHLARAALQRLGVPPVPLRRGLMGEPLWPDGVVGSLTHCDGYRAAAVAHRAGVVAVGIDAEAHAPLPDEVPSIVLSGDERTLVERLTRQAPAVCWDRLLFSAKESLFKAWYPQTGRWLEFEDAAVDVDPESGVFRAHVRAPATPMWREGVEGRWLVRGPLLLTAVVITTG